MKITIAYLPDEEAKARLLQSIVERIIPGTKVRESDRNAPFKHIYIATKKPETHCAPKGNT